MLMGKSRERERSWTLERAEIMDKARSQKRWVVRSSSNRAHEPSVIGTDASDLHVLPRSEWVSSQLPR